MPVNPGHNENTARGVGFDSQMKKIRKGTCSFSPVLHHEEARMIKKKTLAHLRNRHINLF